MHVVRTALVAAAAPALLLPFATMASAAATDSACSNGPWSGPGTTTGTVPGCTTRVSMAYDNTEPDGTSQRPRISEDGNYVVFQSGADHLVPNWTAGHGTDDYWVDKRDPAGTIEMVDRAADGGMPNGAATFVDVSGDGRYVVFYSQATNLVAGTTTRAGSVFLRDMTLNKTIEVPHSATGGETNAYSNRPTISGSPDANGDYYVAYNSKGTNLVPGATHVDDVYVTRFDPQTFSVSAPKLVSQTTGGAPSNGQNEHAEISADGTQVAWQSTATNLSNADNDTISDIYEARNPFLNSAARPVLVSVSSAGAKGKAPSTRPAIDANGDEVAWESTASNLVPNDTNAALDCFLRGTQPGAFIGNGNTVRVSVDYNGNQLTGASQRPNLDGAGDKVGFAANAHTVVKGDRNSQRDVFLRDLSTGRNYLIDVSQSGGFASPTSSPNTGEVTPQARSGGSDLSSRAFLSADGLSVAFISGMSDLVPNDNNSSTSLDDIFVRDFTTN